MKIRELRLKDLEPERFIEQKVEEIKSIVGRASALNALSGGVDSSTVTILGHRALGDRLDRKSVV
jgi:GMP synthase (glutamine-hydrolysing)